MIFLPDGSEVSAHQKVLALTYEAKRRGLSYGALTRSLDVWETERIVLRWWEDAQKEKQIQAHTCDGCKYWKYESETCPSLGRMCHFSIERGRSRRRGRDGTCLEREVSGGRKETGREG